LPPHNECTIDFLKDVCAGRKFLLTNAEVKLINVPRIKELSAKLLQKEALDDPLISKFLPDISNKQVLSKEFLFNIINSVKPSFFPTNVRELMRLKQEKIAQKKEKFVYVTNHIYNLFQQTLIVPKSKLFPLSLLLSLIA
jgi:hypothetical protein